MEEKEKESKQATRDAIKQEEVKHAIDLLKP